MIEDVSAKRLYELREKNGLSTRAAAERIGTSSSVWNRWENGKNRMTSFFIIQICKEFGVSADWLLGLTD
ncbi:MAG: helix-turn-helix transcriptional regulator [bacterium]|nr:helix-turn-helix transcriptional regulator [bacterium]